MALLGMVVVSGIALLVWAAHPSVYVVNAHPYPVKVTAGRRSVTVRPKSVARFQLPLGTAEAKAFDDSGVEMETVKIAARPPYGTIVWNITGAAPVYSEEVVYSRNAGKPKMWDLCGRSVVIWGYMPTIDAFVEPPSSAQKGTRRLHVDVLNMRDPRNECP